jgi:glycosyltransferase involved in cell wall biosynthesis
MLLFSFLERLAARWCDQIITVSEYHREWAQKLGIGNNIKTISIPNGLREDRVSGNENLINLRDVLGVGSGEYIILTFGRLTKQKGIEYLIRALSLVKESRAGLAIKLLIVGNGSLREKLKKLSSRLSIDDKVLFLGFQEGIGKYIRISDLVVLPSLWEGLSISLLEAMAAGKPIITTRIGSNVEVTENGYSALLVQPKNEFEIAKAIMMLLDNKMLAKEYSKRAKKRYSSSYTEVHMTEGYIDMYSKLVCMKT